MQSMTDNENCLSSVLNLVDLAGSECTKKSGVTGDAFVETCKINLSLLTLGTVINQLINKDYGHVSYRDSRLTHLLRHSLGGNSNTVIICSIALTEYEETNRTLGYVNIYVYQQG